MQKNEHGQYNYFPKPISSYKALYNFQPTDDVITKLARRSQEAFNLYAFNVSSFTELENTGTSDKWQEFYKSSSETLKICYLKANSAVDGVTLGQKTLELPAKEFVDWVQSNDFLEQVMAKIILDRYAYLGHSDSAETRAKFSVVIKTAPLMQIKEFTEGLSVIESAV